MAETVHIEIPEDDWVKLSSEAATLNGRVSNSGNAVLVYVQAETKPDADSNSGHRLVDDNLFDYFVNDPEALWMRALNAAGIASVTPDLATPLGGAVTLGKGDLIDDAWGIPKVSFPFSLFHGLFTFDIPKSQWFTFENGAEVDTSTNIVSVGGMAVLTTDAVNTELLLESRECPRYQPNRGHLFSTALLCPNKTNDGVRQWGVGFVGENGVGFQLKADGLLYAVLLSGGVITHEEAIDTSVLGGFDVEKNNTYDIQYQWRSAGDYFFYIGDPTTGLSKLVHRFKLLGTLTGASMQNPALPAHFYASRTTEDVVMKVGCVDITSENGSTDREVYNSAYADSVTVSTDTPVLIVKQPLQINGTSNTRTITLARVSVKCSKKATFKVWTTRDPANITGATFKALGDGSFVESDSPDMDPTAVRATAVTVANLHFITSIPVEALVRVPVDNPHRGRIEFPIVRGDHLIVTGSAASGISECVVEFGGQI